MVTLEQVEKLRQYGNITFDQAKMALEETNGDILEAVIVLEKQGLLQEPKNGGYHSSKNEEKNQPNSLQRQKYENESDEDRGTTFSELIKKFLNWAGQMIKKGNENHFEISKGDEKIMSIPTTIFAFFIIFMFWFTVPALIIGLFFGYRYSFTGPDLGKKNINDAMDSVADAAEKIKKDMKGDKPNGEDFNN